VLILVAVGLVLALGVYSGLTNTRDLLRRQATQIVGSIASQVGQHLKPARHLTESLTDMAKRGLIDLDSNQQLAEAMRAAGAAVPQVAYVGYLDLDHRMIGIDLSGTRLDLLESDWSVDEEMSAAMRGLQHNDSTYWGAPVYIAESHGSFVNVRTPVTVNGKPRGLFVAAVGVDDLSEHLRRLVQGGALGGGAFILSGPERVVAYSSQRARVSSLSADDPLPSLQELGDPVMAVLWDPDLSRPLGGALRAGFDGTFLRLDADRYVVVYQYLHGFGPIPWIVGTYFPMRDIAEELRRLVNAVVAGLVVLVLAVTISLLLGRRISLPVLRLAKAARELREQGPESVAALPPTRLRELSDAAQAFNEMTAGLRERELILSTFGKYVPKSVVADLLTDGGRPPAETRVATIFFSDIEGFSTLSEAMAPEELVNLLNEYFTLVCEPIERLGGVINQYQGDAVVASFNMPIVDTNHAGKAVLAAVEIQKQLKDRTVGAGHMLNTRIGINPGLVVGGSVGTPGRLSYTVHGDSVNVAARIEELNKRWHTRILVAESTHDLCADQFPFEYVGDEPIRGRSQSAKLYSVSV
jgi:class 3 adenylate cyclase